MNRIQPTQIIWIYLSQIADNWIYFLLLTILYLAFVNCLLLSVVLSNLCMHIFCLQSAGIFIKGTTEFLVIVYWVFFWHLFCYFTTQEWEYMYIVSLPWENGRIAPESWKIMYMLCIMLCICVWWERKFISRAMTSIINF